MDTTGIDESAAETGLSFVQHLFVGPVIFKEVLGTVNIGIASWCIAWDDGVISLEVAVVEGAVGIIGQVDCNERHVSGRIEDVQIHDGTLNEESLGVGSWHDGSPRIAGPVLVLCLA